MSGFLLGLAKLGILVLILVCLVLSFQAAEKAPNKDEAFLKTVVFWVICFVVCLVMCFLAGMLNIKRAGSYMILAILIGVVCWAIYGLMFGGNT